MPETLKEAGYEGPPPSPPGQMPPGGGKWITPDFERYVSIFNFISRTYYWTHDEALKDSGTCNTDAMWADPVISTAIRDRQRPVVQLESQLEPRNPSDPQEKKYKTIVTEILQEIPRFQQLRRCLLDAMWWGRAGVELVFGWNHDWGDKRLVVKQWAPVHGDSLVFKFDGTVGYLVNATAMRQEGVQVIEGRSGYAKFLNADQDQCLLVHEFEPMPADFYRPDMAGAVHGTGLRGRVYWFWWLKQNLMRIMMNFAKKVGNGFFLAGFEAGNATELANMQKAMEQQGEGSTIYVPISQSRSLEQVLKHLPVSLEGANFQWQIIQGLNGLIRDAILGNSMANEAAPAGLGGSNAEHMGMTDDERVKYDAVDLETPMQKLVDVIYRYIAPQVRPARFQHLADKRNPEEVMACAKWFMEGGGVVPMPWAQSELGIPEPLPDEPTMSLIQSQQAAALGSVPAGEPMAGSPGPAGADGGQGAPPDAGQGSQGGGLPPELASQIQPMQMARYHDWDGRFDYARTMPLAEELALRLRVDMANTLSELHDKSRKPVEPPAPAMSMASPIGDQANGRQKRPVALSADTRSDADIIAEYRKALK